ncbi:D-alanyl-D-alanine carboxypeptidase/D-alanyl-D-alanine-endopeptidase (penicillin-binding protein 4) [Melghirimyces profundicolus]|uniref:D-alanyl-D-alanine carboxypeptidase/D-alanyl-D-alanine-endopeptidase (Penicillin-binding protein 4) n=1 Tax=Melghirimyces profundicolus TaxID=1242148 RepID=A0A2T6C9I9_9BACL|nr:D-alanyl-D-alanine carboxypeptidase/D-alanyl-D-alanine-endopeptidase [Melghirimyces profundicolus]PTX64936.1 D-alanyl-D-alanine carboxypeptidase/D-alanyl-D-alanine-endopeptidase (penicillin-binding protein 4) [Melghirimyces profundicolus]
MNLPEKMNRLIGAWAARSGEKGARVGCALFCFRTGRRWDLDGEKRFVPASNNKIWTTLTALEELGPEHRWYTRFAAEEGGRLWIRGGGDPSFDVNAATEVARALRRQGLTRLEGPVLLDDGLNRDAPWGRGWAWDDLAQGYSAPVHALNMEHNRIAFRFDPSSPTPEVIGFSPVQCRAGAEVRLSWSEDPDAEIRIFRTEGPYGFRLEGEVFRGDPEVRAAVASGPEFFAQVFLEVLREEGIRVPRGGEVRTGPFPRQPSIRVDQASRPLVEALSLVNGESDNLVAEVLLRSLGLKETGFLSQEAGIQKVLGRLAKRRLVPPEVMADGSGLSMYNLSTPSSLNRALVWARKKHPWFTAWLKSLPRYGKSGTLRDRRAFLPDGVEVAAKTGTLSGVKSLSGYLLRGKEPTLAFSLLVNGLLDEKNGEKLQDEVLQLFSAIG